MNIIAIIAKENLNEKWTKLLLVNVINIIDLEQYIYIMTKIVLNVKKTKDKILRISNKGKFRNNNTLFK